MQSLPLGLRLSLAMLFLCWGYDGFSQAHPELFGVDESKGIHYTIDFYFDADFGNFSQRTLLLNPTISYHIDNEEIMMEGHFQHGFFEGDYWQNQNQVVLRNIFRHTSRFASDIFAQYQNDNLIQLSYRWQAGAGVRTTVFEKTPTESRKFSSFWGLNLLLEREKFDVLDAYQRDQQIRYGSYLTFFNQFNEDINWALAVHFQGSFLNSRDLRHTLISEISYNLNERLSITQIVRYRYDNNPAIILKKFDLYTLIGLTLIL